METFLYATAVTLAWLLFAAYFVVASLCALVVGIVGYDVYKMFKLRKQRRNGMH